jgi:hypothetical protein
VEKFGAHQGALRSAEVVGQPELLLVIDFLVAKHQHAVPVERRGYGLLHPVVEWLTKPTTSPMKQRCNCLI